jgi:O-antigen/teichoic acid export membrane protein
VNRLLIVPSAIVGVLFPAFSTGLAQNQERTRVLFRRGLKYTFLTLFPCVLIIIVFAREGLTWWVGPEFAQNGAVVLQCLTIGVLFNGLAQVPFALVLGAGRPDMTGKLHLLELPVYALLLWFLVRRYGIAGAAMAWSVRALADALVLFVMAERFLPAGESMPRKTEERSLAQDW